MIPVHNEIVLFDFSPSDVRLWLPVDDAVMGGVSNSAMRIENGRAVFAALVSLDFGGGFASVRSNAGLWLLGSAG
jgi:hypothetical protein